MKVITLFIAIMLPITAATQVRPGNAYEKIGPVGREIMDKSPVASEAISLTVPAKGYSYKIAIHAVLTNTSDHEIKYINPSQYYNVVDAETGKRAPETETGCYMNFFSDCFRPSAPSGTAGSDAVIKIGSHHSYEIKPDDFLDMLYKLVSGRYLVTGYFCAVKQEGPECFKSNTIMITIPEAGQQ